MNLSTHTQHLRRMISSWLFSLFLLVSQSLVGCNFTYCEDFTVVDIPLKVGEATMSRVLVNLSQVNGASQNLHLTIDPPIDIDETSKESIESNVVQRLAVMHLPSLYQGKILYTVGTALQILLDSQKPFNQHPQYFYATSRIAEQRQAEVADEEYIPLLPQWAKEHKAAGVIKIYQTIDAFTGGTTAMRTMHTALQALQFESVLCNDTNIEREACNSPSDTDIAVTGEWCAPVLDEYLSRTSPKKVFHGRGVQYYLGFHHGRDSCRGWIAAADSHFIATTLLHRHLHAFYLGCVMAEHIASSYRALRDRIRVGKDTTRIFKSSEDCVEVTKEKLILVDADFFDDYPPSTPITFQAPADYQVIVTKGFSPEVLLSLLHRAQIVLDLALPGPERLASEAILFGALPLVSNRWNGASQIDYPHLLRVDTLNGSDVTHRLQQAVDHYEHYLKEAAAFHKYIASMPVRNIKTLDAYFSSASLHFVLDARESERGRTLLSTETAIIFQVLGLLYLHPLSSIDILVRDVRWFVRHHYVFVDLLFQAGYLRADPMDPAHFASYLHEEARSFVRIRSAVSDTSSGNQTKEESPAAEDERMSADPDRPWHAFKVQLSSGVVFREVRDVYALLQKHLSAPPSTTTVVVLQCPDEEEHEEVLVVAGRDVSVSQMLQERRRLCSGKKRSNYDNMSEQSGRSSPNGVDHHSGRHAVDIASDGTFFTDAASGYEAEDHPKKRKSGKKSSFVHVCELLHRQKTEEVGVDVDDDVNIESLVGGVTDTLFWQSQRTIWLTQLQDNSLCNRH